MTLTAIVIDDSPLQQFATCKLINNNPNLKLTASFNDPKVGLEAVNRFRPDVVFLDVEMPGLNGFEFLENLNHDCQVILNSTRSQFALTAFQYNQVKDYLTKPMARPRFEKSIERVVKNKCAKQKIEKPHTVPVYHERLREAS
ncbi:LytR/AlgR family response regulator transcription factor [Flagellimonas sp. S174]|uniref:LytR/AlgR family response regulator transcription factor n=1 Tax=Flagellimonas sp. S174 TaxID=3410790 RepID=UPI003BF5BA6A